MRIHIRQKRSYDKKLKIKFLGVRIGKNLLVLLNSLVMMMQLTNEGLDKWVLPFQIILVLYFVVIIYFIVNTGELINYMVDCSSHLEYCSVQYGRFRRVVLRTKRYHTCCRH
jgi:hypothetical protein